MRVLLAVRSGRPRLPRLGPGATLAAVALVAAALGVACAWFVRADMPALGGLEEYSPPEMTRILARDGTRIAAFAAEKRILLDYDEIPVSFRQALIDSEDSRFELHAGIDPVGVARALWSDLRRRSLTEGASTLTMQLAGNLFLDRSQRTIRRKLQEAFLALEIERRFSKQEILRMYANQVCFGHGRYGVEAAARFYFGKPARSLSVGQSAMLVGLLPRPASYSPYRDVRRATERRNLVLRRMVEEGHLSAAEAQRAAAEPVVPLPRKDDPGFAAYFVEDVRRRLHERHGGDELYRGGLVVTTTLDAELQRMAERSVDRGLRELDRRAGRPAATAEPGVQAALIALDPRTGEIRAHVGGRDFARSQFDRAIQARRQPGSLFKPFVYAAALARGWTLADTLVDEPTVFLDPRRPVPYQPENFDRRYHGRVTLREALEHSYNIVAVELLDRVGAAAVIDTARGFGLGERLRPYPSLALGAFELSLLELASAYGALANQGLLVEPYAIRAIDDRHGRPVARARSHVSEAISPQVAYLVNEALRGVIDRGTGRAAGAALGRTLAGKTGTTDDYTDAWFVGYTPSLVVGVWVGFDEPRSLGRGGTGAGAALPIWIDFMRGALAGTPDGPFARPSGIVTATIDPRTGRRADRRAGCRGARVEVFLEGTEPPGACGEAWHRRLRLPYPFQRYPIEPDGSLAIPGNELDELLAAEPSVYLEPMLMELRSGGGDDGFATAVTVLPDTSAPAARAEGEAGAPRLGADGRAARTTWLGEARQRARPVADEARAPVPVPRVGPGTGR